ncbi:MAG: hypothetical protein RL148_2446 [Planctomycetota bacterium]|jgi:hypothetical protein
MRSATSALHALSIVLALAASAVAQAEGGAGKKSQPAAEPPVAAPPAGSANGPVRFTTFPVPEADPLDVAAATRDAVAAMLELQEGPGDDQWPYEGVYREDRGQLPVGYRVGGTAIACMGLLAAPGWEQDEARRAAVAKGVHFVLQTLDHPRMSHSFLGTYDVRGWGHVYALQLFLHLVERRVLDGETLAAVEKRIPWLVQALVDSAIPRSGGWNYSLRRGFRNPGNAASTFMTAPALQALFHARTRGHAVPDQTVMEALDALERSRAKPGGYAYGASGHNQNEVEEAQLGMMNRTPSSAARATLCEVTLRLAGRGDPVRLERAVELFFAEWDALAVRKSQTGTHVEPYGIAPYYFLFGHTACAQAIEQVTEPARREQLRDRLHRVLARSRDADGTWNDRQFPRSAGYGTAMALLALHMKDWPAPVTWQPATKGD